MGSGHETMNRSVAGGGGGGGGGGDRTCRTSSKKHVKNYIPFLGMRKVHGDLQRLTSKHSYHQSLPGFNGVQCFEHFYSKSRTSLHCQKVGEIPGYG